MKKPILKDGSKLTKRDVAFRTPPTSPDDLVLENASSYALSDRNLNTTTDGDDGDHSTTTVKASNTSRPQSKSKQVQFGSPSVVEYVIGEPSQALTPLPTEVARQRYPMDQKKESAQEEEMTAETKHNNSILAQWDDAFDQSDSAGGKSPVGRRRSTGSSSSSRRRKREGRRSSSIFSPKPIRLVDTEEDEMDTSSDQQKTCAADEIKERETSPPASVPVVSEVSPSVEVASNLASLSMSPNDDSDDSNPFHASKTAMSNDVAAHPDSDTGENTWEGYVDLSAVNVSGGAMEVSPPTPALASSRSDTSIDQTTAFSSAATSGLELTPPSTHVSMSSIHSLGGAMDDGTAISPTFAGNITHDLNSPCLSRRPPTPAVPRLDTVSFALNRTHLTFCCTSRLNSLCTHIFYPLE